MVITLTVSDSFSHISISLATAEVSSLVFHQKMERRNAKQSF